jgi:hypothetical protein
MSEGEFESDGTSSRISHQMLIIPKPGREIPKSVEPLSRQDRALVVKSIGNEDLHTVDRNGMPCAKGAGVSFRAGNLIVMKPQER